MKKIFIKLIYLLVKHNIIKSVTIAKLKYFYKFHKRLNLSHPRNINEKINWIKFYGDTSKWSELADKFKVRQFIDCVGYGNTLVQLYGKWDSPEFIDWDKLPSSFVLKANNGCGDIIICNDKSKLNKDYVIKHFKKNFLNKYGLVSGEPHYSMINPCIIAEELLDYKKQSIKSNSLVDYKIYCFNGAPTFVFLTFNRCSEKVNIALYDMQWNNISHKLIPSKHYTPFLENIPKPYTFDKMIQMAKTLSQEFPIVRVDLYEVEKAIYFGELTFTPLGGYLDNFNEELLFFMGSKIDVNYGKA